MKNNIFYACLFISFVFLLGNCESYTGKLNEVYEYPENLWGEWIRMDNGRTWYIASNYITIENYYSSSAYSMSRQSDNVIKVTEKTGNSEAVYYLYASRIPNSSFNASVFMEGNQMSEAALLLKRAVSAAGGMKAKIPNVKNPASSPEATTDEDGNLNVDGVIAGDEYDVIIGNDIVRVTPNTDGDDVGTITLLDGNGLNFKTSIQPVQSNLDMMRLFTNQDYDVNVIITNTGSITARYSNYTMSIPDGLTVTGSPLNALLGTIDPGRTHTIRFTVNSSPILKDSELKKIGITIKDNMSQMEWEDSVSLKFNKSEVNFKIRAMRILGSSGNINGMIIVPGGKAYHFSAAGSDTNQPITTVTVPKYAGKDYLIAFSGATIGNELAFSFRINGDPGIIPPDFIPNEFYFIHATENSAKVIEPDEQIMSFLGAGDIIYFKTSLPDEEE